MTTILGRQALPSTADGVHERVRLDLLPAEGLGATIGVPASVGARMLRAVFDATATLVAVCAFLVIGPLVAAAVKLDSPGPVLYRQRRVGLHGEEFDIVKFRTMRADAEQWGPRFASAADARVTGVGRFLRRSRLDELPQALNLLRRQMSLIGPRPERPEFVAQFRRQIPSYDARHAVRPGLTGWAQVTEGYVDGVDGTWRKVERDLYYIARKSILLDCRILVRTVRCVLMLSGR
jgi:lipopolysaccharide/colanic/teichoic acid biosynthesis glycosyltransferase